MRKAVDRSPDADRSSSSQRRRFLQSILPLLAASAIASFDVRAQAALSTGDCPAVEDTAALRACEGARHLTAARRMELAYEGLSRKSDSRDREKLHAAQEAWLRFRKAEVEYQSSFAEGGTLKRLIAANVSADLTEARAQELERIARAIR